MKIISFEGIEGVGKSTQLRILKDYLESKNFLVDVYREPGSTNTGEKNKRYSTKFIKWIIKWSWTSFNVCIKIWAYKTQDK